MSSIWLLKEGDPDIKKVATYSLPPKAALVAYIEQIRGNLNTWEYPKELDGMRQSSTIADHWYYDLWKSKGDKINAVIAAYPDGSIFNSK